MINPGGVLWLRTGTQRAVLQAHLRHVAGTFRSQGWVILEGSAAPELPEGSPLAVQSDPFCEPTPALAAALIGARDTGGPRWRAPRVWGLAGAQGWRPAAPPWTALEHERTTKVVRPGVVVDAPGECFLGFVAAPADGLPGLLAEGFPPPAERTGVVTKALMFRYPDPALHTRKELLASVPADARVVVDVGCGHGSFAALLEAPGRRVIGIEPDPALAASARTRLQEVLEAPAEVALGSIEGGVDCFVFSDSLEHVLDPGAILRAAASRLAPGGQIIVSVPNVAFAPVVRALAAGRWDVTLAGVQARDHLFFTTPDSFLRLAAECGLRARLARPVPAPLPLRTKLWGLMLAVLVGRHPAHLWAPQWLFVLQALPTPQAG